MLKTMGLNNAIEILELHNAWRRDRNEVNKYDMQNPTEIGVAIDEIIKAAKKYQHAMNVLHQIAHPAEKMNVKVRRTKESRHAMAALHFLNSM